jgi:uncharacterized membrane protein YciS (DUF1049 family)
MAANRFFTKVANDVLEATEQLSIRMEEGLTALWTGALPNSNKDDEAHPSSTIAPDSGAEFDDEEEGDWEQSSPLQGIAESVVGDIVGSQAAGPQTPWEHFDAFRHAITWTEPFIVGLIVFHVVIFLSCLYVSRRNHTLGPRLVLMTFIAVTVKSAERLNHWAAAHWQQFATQNYFDARGIFAATLLCAPLLFDSFVMLVFFLREASHLLVQVKTEQLKRKKQQQQQTKKAETKNKQQRRAKKEQ